MTTRLDRQGFQIGDRVTTLTGGRVWIITEFFPGQGNISGTNARLVLEGRKPTIYSTTTVLTTRLRRPGDKP